MHTMHGPRQCERWFDMAVAAAWVSAAIARGHATTKREMGEEPGKRG
jgi:hypothetical protein